MTADGTGELLALGRNSPSSSKASCVALVLGRSTAREHAGSDAVYELLLTFPGVEMVLVVGR